MKCQIDWFTTQTCWNSSSQGIFWQYPSIHPKPIANQVFLLDLHALLVAIVHLPKRCPQFWILPESTSSHPISPFFSRLTPEAGPRLLVRTYGPATPWTELAILSFEIWAGNLPCETYHYLKSSIYLSTTILSLMNFHLSFYKNQKSKHELFLCWLGFRKLSSNLSPFWIVTPFEFLIGSGQNISKKHPTDSEKIITGSLGSKYIHRIHLSFSPKRRGSTPSKIQGKYLCPWVCIPRLWDSHRFRSEILCKAVRNDYVAPDESTVLLKASLEKSVGGEGGKHTKSRLVTVEWIPIPKIQRPLEMLRENCETL